MNEFLNVRATSRQDKDGTEYWEGSFTLPGAVGKLNRRADNSTRFPSRSSLSQAARNFAKELGYELQFVDATAAKTPARKAAKKSTPKATPCTGTTCTAAS